MQHLEYHHCSLLETLRQHTSEPTCKHNTAGITGVKVDCQAGIGLAGSALGGGPTVGKRYHAALEDSVEQHFPGNHCINCMCHSTENLYRWASPGLQQASSLHRHAHLRIRGAA